MGLLNKTDEQQSLHQPQDFRVLKDMFMQAIKRLHAVFSHTEKKVIKIGSCPDDTHFF